MDSYTAKELAAMLQESINDFSLPSAKPFNHVEQYIPQTYGTQKRASVKHTSYNGQKLQEFRREHKFSQRQVAEILGKSPSVVTKYEKGEVNLSSEDIVKLNRLGAQLSLDTEEGKQPCVVKKYIRFPLI